MSIAIYLFRPATMIYFFLICTYHFIKAPNNRNFLRYTNKITKLMMISDTMLGNNQLIIMNQRSLMTSKIYFKSLPDN